MFIVSWIQGDDINYRFLTEKDLPDFLAKLRDEHVIVQKLAA